MRFIFIAIVFTITLFAEDISVESFNNLKVLKENGIKVTEFKTQNSIYLLKGMKKTKRGKTSFLFYMTKDLKYTFFGQGFDDKAQALYIPKDMDIYKKYANFTYGNGKSEYYIFTDPQCPYCKKFEKLLAGSDIKGKVKIYYFLYPLAFHSEAIPMSNYILSQKDRAKALKEVMTSAFKEYKKYSNQKGDELLKNEEIGFDMVVRGTPSIFDSQGKLLNYQQFFENLNISVKGKK